MVAVTYSPSGYKLVSQDCTRDDFSTALQGYAPADSGAVTQDSTDKEVVLEQSTSGTGLAYRLDIQQRIGLPPPTVTNLTPSAAMVDTAGNLTKLTPLIDAQCEVEVGGATGAKRFKFTLPANSATIVRSVVGRKPGTMLHQISATAAGLFAGKTPGPTTQNLFSESVAGATPATCSASLNPSCVVAGLDFSYVSFSRASVPASERFRYPVSLVGPRHIVYARHVMENPGETIIWRTPAGGFVQAVVLRVFNLGNDCGCGILDRDVVGVPYAKVLPNNYETKISIGARLGSILTPSSPSAGPVTGVMLTHNPSEGLGLARHAQVCGFNVGNTNPAAAGGRYWGAGKPVEAALLPWWSLPYGGDSSSSLHWIVQEGGQQTPVLITHLHTAGTGPNFAAFADDIESLLNAEAAALGYATPFAFSRADLSLYANLP